MQKRLESKPICFKVSAQPPAEILTAQKEGGSIIDTNDVEKEQGLCDALEEQICDECSESEDYEDCESEVEKNETEEEKSVLVAKQENEDSRQISSSGLSTNDTILSDNENKKIRALLDQKESSIVDDDTIVRFYIAFNKNCSATAKAISKYISWRENYISCLPVVLKDNVPLLITIRGINGFSDYNYDGEAEFVPPLYKKFWKYTGGGTLHKTDSYGRPILIDAFGRYDVPLLTRYSTPDDFCEWHVVNMEFIINHVLKLCSRSQDRNITSGITIIDCKGVGLKHASIKAFEILKKVTQVDATYYPERLKKLYLVNASPLVIKIWNIAKKWLDKDIIKKIVIGQNLYDMADKRDIPPESIPTYLGGTCRCSPSLGGCNPSPSEIIALRTPLLSEKQKTK